MKSTADLPLEGATTTLVRFGRELRRSGLAVSVTQLASLARAFDWLDPTSRTQVYHAARATLLTRREDAAVFDRVWHAFWLGAQAPDARPQPMPLAPRHDQLRRVPLATLLAERAASVDPEIEVRDRTHSASAEEVLRRKDFAAMTQAELASVQRLMQIERWDFLTRLTRRRVGRRTGAELDLRRAVRAAARTGGALVSLPRRQKRQEQRPLVILADVSGSMELYTRVLLTFFHALRQNLRRVETFVFATRLTRISLELGLRSVDRALEEVGARVVDFASGTRIGESLASFNRGWARQVMPPGAVVMIVSDGWERGDPMVLKKEMHTLSRRCHRVIWLNPLLGQPSYEPKVLGMAAALEHVHDFLPCHDLQSLERVAAHLRRLCRRRGGAVAARSSATVRTSASATRAA